MSDTKKQKNRDSASLVLCSALEQPDFGKIRKAIGRKKLLILRDGNELDRTSKGSRPDYLVPVRHPVASFGTIRLLLEKAKEGYTIVLFPELRSSLDGKEGPLPDSVGKLAYIVKLPVEALYVRGSYLMNPVWSCRKKKHSILSGRPEYVTEQLISEEEIFEWDRKTCIREVRKRFCYDEYDIWNKNCLRKYTESLDGLEQVLYQCPNCRKEHLMGTRGRMIYCLSCQASWRISEKGEILPDFDGGSDTWGKNKEDLIRSYIKLGIHHAADWVEFERRQLLRQILSGAGQECSRVLIEVCSKGERQFRELGSGRVTCGLSGFRLELTEGNGQVLYQKNPSVLMSLNLLYDEIRQQLCLEVISEENCYHIVSKEGFHPVKTVLAIEVMHRMWKEGEGRE